MHGSFGKAFAKKYASARGANIITLPEDDPPVNAFINFIAERRLKDGNPCATKLGNPVALDNQSWRILVHHGPLAQGLDWERYAHGTQVHSLYCILYHDRMQESKDPDAGEHLIGGMAGVGCFGWESQKKRCAESYSGLIELFNDGWFYSVKLELRCPSDRVRNHPTTRATGRKLRRQTASSLMASMSG